jgi:hypothetical protein
MLRRTPGLVFGPVHLSIFDGTPELLHISQSCDRFPLPMAGSCRYEWRGARRFRTPAVSSSNSRTDHSICARGGTWNYNYSADDVPNSFRLTTFRVDSGTLAAWPEPLAWLLLASGIGLSLLLGRKRQRKRNTSKALQLGLPTVRLTPPSELPYQQCCDAKQECRGLGNGRSKLIAYVRHLIHCDDG